MTLLELLRESSTNLTTQPYAGPDPKKNLHPHNNEAEDPPQTKTQPKQKQTPWKKKSNKHKPQISLIETENKFELMETESQESPSKQRNPKFPKSLKIKLKSIETIEITESSQMKKTKH